jgi:hypothetical protein
VFESKSFFLFQVLLRSRRVGFILLIFIGNDIAYENMFEWFRLLTYPLTFPEGFIVSLILFKLWLSGFLSTWSHNIRSISLETDIKF